MSHARDAVVGLKARVSMLPRAFAAPVVSPLARLVEVLGAAQASPVIPGADVLELLRKRVVAAFRNGAAGSLSRRDLRDAPWILWAGKAGVWKIPGLLEAIIAHALQSNRTTRNLLEAWLRDFSSDDKSMAAAGSAIKLLLNKSSDARLDIWRNADRRFDLFDAEKGPAKLARALVVGPDSVEETVRSVGFDDPLRSGAGYMRATIQAVLETVPKAIRGRNAAANLERIVAFLSPPEGLRFGQALHGEIGRGLLAPWFDGEREPSAELRTEVQEFLLKHLGDPRLRPAQWTAVGKRETAIVRGWLARASLRTFFRLVSEHAYDKQWKYRESFWTAYLEKGAIDDAWLALGAQVRNSARGIRDLNGSYGRLEGAGVAGDQSVLLLRIGSHVFSEWSHNGKLRAWPLDWKNAPALHRAVYRREDLMGKCLTFPVDPASGMSGESKGEGLVHRGAESGRWQGSAAELIARKTHIRLGKKDWMP